MAVKQSWAEEQWWRGTVFDWMSVLLATAVVFVLAFVSIPTLLHRHTTSNGLKDYYLTVYRSACATGDPRTVALPYVLQPNGVPRLASAGDVVVLPPAASGNLRLALSKAAIARGARGLQFAKVSARRTDSVCAELSRQIEANARASGRGLPWWTLGVAVPIPVAIALGYVQHRRAAKRMRRGQTLRGSLLLSAAQFKRLNLGDGVGFAVRDQVSCPALWLGRSGREVLRVAREEESSHFLLMGDTGTGKSSLIRQLLAQIADRGEAAIVYDPALEFTPQFYEPDRGDQILNPLDQRMPYWSPGDEVQHKAEALAFAKSLFPDDRRDNRFFIEAPRRVFARLLSFRPTAAEIAQWLQKPADIDRRLAGTELASMIDASAPSQRAGVLASLSMVGEAFQLIPDRAETKGVWSAYEWAQHRQGWLFLTSTPQTLDRLRPLISVWFDLLLMRLLAGGPPVWIFLDELPTLNKLPKLPEALAVARKPNVRLVIGLQGRAQLEARYDREAEAMLSQPATKAFLRTSEPRAAEWISKALGEIELERLKESVNQHKMFVGYRRKSHNFSLDRQVKPLVLPSEIMGLKNLTGYVKSEGYVIPIRFEPNPVQSRQPAFVPRPVKSDDSPQQDKLDQLIASALQASAGQPRLDSTSASALAGGVGCRAHSVLRLMLTISRPLSSGQAQRYHAEEFASRAQSYYAEAESARGEWQGRLATDLGLRGEVRSEDFAKVSEGKHPRTGEQLVQQRLPHEYTTADGKTVKTMGHRAAWDATFSAPKSVSITALVGGDERVREAHREAVRVAVDRMEAFVQARMGGNRPTEPTHNWAAAKFEHDTARPVDGYPAPQLHTHVVFFNMTRTRDGGFRAIQSKELYRSQQYGTAVYRAELAWRVRELGYDLRAGTNGAPEIKGYSREYLEANSPRRQQIQEHLKDAGLSGAGPAQIAAHRTREAKQPLDRSDVKALHRAVAEAHGNQPGRVVQEARERHPAQTLEPARHAHAAVTYARDKTFEREAVVDQRELLKEALKHASGKAPSEQVSKALDERIKRGEFVAVGCGRPGSPARQYTTPATIANERRNIEHMRQGQNRFQPLVSGQIASEAAQSERLNQSQRRVVSETLSSRDRIVAVQGVAGSGKTTALREIRIAAQREGYKVQGLAPTSRAAFKLEEAGISSKTLQRHLAEPVSHSGRGQLYVVDESSLVSTKQTEEFLERLGPNDRVVLVGDTRQHQAVEAGRPFEQLQDAGMRTAKLDEIVRQTDPGLKRVVDDLAHGRVREAVAALQSQGRIHEIPDRSERINAIARDYTGSSGRTLVVAPDNQSRRDLNDHIRQELKDRGAIGRQDHQATVLVPRQDMTGADRAWAAQYREGDVIRYTKGSQQLGIKPGEYATVREVDARENALKVECSDRSTKEYDPRRLRGVAVYEKAERKFSEGDRVQLTAPHKAAGLANRELGTIERVDSSGGMKLRMDSGRTAVIASGAPAHVDHGYAVTSHSAQGATADRVIVHAESGQSAALVNQRFAYVAGSRMREGLDVYTDNAQALTSSLERQFDKAVAVHDEGVGSGLESAANSQSKGDAVTIGHSAEQGHPPQVSSRGQDLGHGR